MGCTSSKLQKKNNQDSLIFGEEPIEQGVEANAASSKVSKNSKNKTKQTLSNNKNKTLKKNKTKTLLKQKTGKNTKKVVTQQKPKLKKGKQEKIEFKDKALDQKKDLETLQKIIQQQKPQHLDQNYHFKKHLDLFDDEDQQENQDNKLNQKQQYWNTIFTSEIECMKYCLEQIQNLEKQENKIFKDTEFGSQSSEQNDQMGEKSLFYDFQFSTLSEEKILWLSPLEIVELQEKNGKKFDKSEKNIKFLDNGATSNDVIQGCLGNCWFISSLILIASNDTWIRGNIKSNKKWNDLKLQEKQNMSQGVYPPIFHFMAKYGIYVFRFFKDKQWVYVVVDDKIPVKQDGSFIFSHCRNTNEFWVNLIEKAYAKLHNCYEALNSGDISQGLEDLTSLLPLKIKLSGFHVDILRNDQKFVNFENEKVTKLQLNDKTIDIEKLGITESIQQYDQEKEDLWKFLLKAKQNGSLMGCSADGICMEGDILNKDEKETGLFYGHAYAILDCFELNYNDKVKKQQQQNKKKVHRILRLKNPWGFGEWQLKWSEKDENLKIYMEQIQDYYIQQEKLAKEKDIEPPEPYTLDSDDGTFLISYKDWRQIFTSLFIGQKLEVQWNGKQIQQKWDFNTSSGKITKKEQSKINYAQKNYQYVIQSEKDINQLQIIASLSQHDIRLYKDQVFPYEDISFKLHLAIFKLDKEENKLQKFDDSKLVITTGGYNLRRQVNTGIVKLQNIKKGDKYVIIPSTLELVQQCDFTFSLYYDCNEDDLTLFNGQNNQKLQMEIIEIEDEQFKESQNILEIKQFMQQNQETMLANFQN